MDYEHKVNFEYKGKELTAYVNTKMLNNDGTQGTKIPKFHDSEIDNIVDCEDSITGEKIKVTKAIEALIIFALREELGGEDDEYNFELRFFRRK